MAETKAKRKERSSVPSPSEKSGFLIMPSVQSGSSLSGSGRMSWPAEVAEAQCLR